ncbi:omptin family outer membrane protease [Rhizobium ruizarguesonis]|uniref:omptin family outer membrane protease n=1 Tax=Rhizobium ruizarguesonis TaxID=2081791 RepID=UPI0037096609
MDRIIYGDETSRIAVGAGVHYTDIKWSAYGGSGIYSTGGGFRNDYWENPDWVKGISYRQQIPIGFLNLSGKYNFGDLTISGDLQTGLSFGIKDTGDHWLRGLRFHDDIDPAPTIGATVGLDYAMTPATSLYLSGSFLRVFNSRGETREVNTEDGTSPGWQGNAAGANFQSMSIYFQLNATF